MNDELKMKWHSIYGQLLFDRKLMASWKQVKANKGCGGIDNETLETFESDKDAKIIELLEELKTKTYKPKPVKRVYIPKKDGKKRPLGIPIIKDRIVQQSMVNILNPKFEDGIFHKCSCGYRPDMGIERVIQIILWYIERGYNHIYDCDIKGFFDNIPHKKLMKILNKYIADGTTLDMIYKWLKAGYMEEGKYMETNAGAPQGGGVISPLLSNIYLNELDWELEKEGIKFVRYCDDFLLFAKSESEIKRAGAVAKKVIESLGLEVAINKTKFVDFNKDDFKFVGFEFKHWRERKNGDQKYFMIEPTKESLKDFKHKIKKATPKFYTLGKEEWVNRVNPIIRGKVNYYGIPCKAIQKNRKYGQESRCITYGIGRELHKIDAYTRRRLRVCMIHKHPSVRKGMARTHAWGGIEFFCKIKLIPANWLFNNKISEYPIEKFIKIQTSKGKKKRSRYYERLRNKGVVVYTKEKLEAIAYCKSLVTT